MMDKILSAFGVVRASKLEELSSSLENLRTVLEDMRLDLYMAVDKPSVASFPVPVIPVDTEDPEPANQDLRKAFIARVAAFHFDVLDKKIKRMVSDVRGEFSSQRRGLQSAFQVYAPLRAQIDLQLLPSPLQFGGHRLQCFLLSQF